MAFILHPEPFPEPLPEHQSYLQVHFDHIVIRVLFLLTYWKCFKRSLAWCGDARLLDEASLSYKTRQQMKNSLAFHTVELHSQLSWEMNHPFSVGTDPSLPTIFIVLYPTRLIHNCEKHDSSDTWACSLCLVFSPPAMFHHADFLNSQMVSNHVFSMKFILVPS